MDHVKKLEHELKDICFELIRVRQEIEYVNKEFARIDHHEAYSSPLYQEIRERFYKMTQQNANRTNYIKYFNQKLEALHNEDLRLSACVTQKHAEINNARTLINNSDKTL